VIKVDATAFKKRLYFFVITSSSIDGIFTRIVLVCGTSHGQGRVRYNSKCVGARLN
jgi:hypothetical protein